MKKAFYLFGFLALFFSCSDDDNTSDEETETTSIIRISEVNTELGQVVLKNFGTASIDISSYQLCLGPGTYVNVASATEESTIINADESITLSYDINETSGGLSIFSAGGNFGSTDPEILIDYFQWGAADQERVDQAVTAGVWDDESRFVNSDNTTYTFTGEPDDFGSDFW